MAGKSKAVSLRLVGASGIPGDKISISRSPTVQKAQKAKLISSIRSNSLHMTLGSNQSVKNGKKFSMRDYTKPTNKMRQIEHVQALNEYVHALREIIKEG